MSYFYGEVGKVRIQKSMQEQFGYLFHEEYDKITDPFLADFATWFTDSEYYFEPLNKWSHWDMKKEWVGRYKPSYEDGIFTYGCYWNLESTMNQFYSEFFDKILPYIQDEVLEHDEYEESDL